jgi:hypothetical protein
MSREDTHLELLDLNRITLQAKWLPEGRFQVTRLLKGEYRGRWVFQHAGNNIWKCTLANSVYIRQRDADPWDTCWAKNARVPDDIKLKARDFLMQQRIRPTYSRPKTIKRILERPADR